ECTPQVPSILKPDGDCRARGADRFRIDSGRVLDDVVQNSQVRLHIAVRSWVQLVELDRSLLHLLKVKKVFTTCGSGPKLHVAECLPEHQPRGTRLTFEQVEATEARRSRALQQRRRNAELGARPLARILGLRHPPGETPTEL